MLVDVHAHLDHERFSSDIDQVIERCRKHNVTVITNGVNKVSNRNVLALSKKYPDVVKAALGLYPLDALGSVDDNTYQKTFEPFDVNEEIAFIEHQKNAIIALGEVGLDRAFVTNKDKEQQANLQKVIDLSEKIKKPLILHTRKAEQDVLDMLDTTKNKHILLHCFMGNFKLVKRAADNGYYFSIPPIIMKTQHFQLMVERVDINQLLTETDSPFLAPPNVERNEPMHVATTLEMIAKIKNMDKLEVQNNIFSNFQKLFL